MQAIVALFSDESTQRIYRIWDQLRANDGVSRDGVIPHISWHVAKRYPLDKVKALIDNETSYKVSFFVNSTGLGIFRGGTSYLYLPVTVTQVMLEQHQRIFRTATDLCFECNEYFEPDIWVPHITIQFNPLLKENVCQSILDSWDFIERMKLEITSYGLIDSHTGGSGILFRSSLKG